MTPARMAAIHAASFTNPRPWSEPEFAAFLATPGVFALSGRDGFLLGRTILDEAELLTLAVEPAARRAGTGGRLTQAFADAARGRGARRAFLEVAADNLAAQALYLANGWQVAGRRKGYYRLAGHPPLDAVLMNLTLGPGQESG
ncbi:GNAT family N-acetyltransferase [Paracoccus pacificus]|uniref:GNAT family N-acetyltransferase n=1 Tax=Paracoccus pacificus TaxID=1463598 RepID=A0ABW4R7J6_9RHOB